jgi:hypothetical protein
MLRGGAVEPKANPAVSNIAQTATNIIFFIFFSFPKVKYD